jgi:hypothetical protein
MFFSVTKDTKRQCYPLCIFPWRKIKSESVTPYVFFIMCVKKRQCYPYVLLDNDDKKNDSVTPYVLFNNERKKRPWCPLRFIWQRPIKNNSVFIGRCLMFFSMTKDKKRQCYPLCIFSWRVIKSDSVTPYVLLYNDDKKNDSVTPYVFFHDEI